MPQAATALAGEAGWISGQRDQPGLAHWFGWQTVPLPICRPPDRWHIGRGTVCHPNQCARPNMPAARPMAIRPVFLKYLSMKQAIQILLLQGAAAWLDTELELLWQKRNGVSHSHAGGVAPPCRTTCTVCVGAPCQRGCANLLRNMGNTDYPCTGAKQVCVRGLSGASNV